MEPKVGETAIYVESDEQETAAIITHVWSDECVNMVVFNHANPKIYSMPIGPASRVETSVIYDESGKPNTWHWTD